LRRALRKRRASLSVATRQRCARAVARHLLRCRRIRQARQLALYLSVGAELSTFQLIQALSRRGACMLWVPKVGKQGMRFVRFRAGRCRRDHGGMPAPAGFASRMHGRGPRVILLPLLGFDGEGNRLGGGRGYYDRALANVRRTGTWLVGYAYAAQRVPLIPADPWDVRMDAVVTEAGIERLPGKPVTTGAGG
jgi:5-formyltetrahydrofolate cyclo-ligase